MLGYNYMNVCDVEFLATFENNEPQRDSESGSIS